MESNEMKKMNDIDNRLQKLLGQEEFDHLFIPSSSVSYESVSPYLYFPKQNSTEKLPACSKVFMSCQFSSRVSI